MVDFGDAIKRTGTKAVKPKPVKETKTKCQFCNKEFKNISVHEKRCKSNPDYKPLVKPTNNIQNNVLEDQIKVLTIQIGKLNQDIADIKTKKIFDPILKENIKIMCCSLITTWGGKSKPYITMIKSVIKEMGIIFTEEEKIKYSKKITF